MFNLGTAIILGIALCETLAQYFIRKYNSDISKYALIAGAVLLYTIIVFLLVKTYDYQKMAIANVLWNALTSILVAVVGYYAFSESLSWLQIMGFVVVIIGMGMINI
jgi:multidrug transporter EmrE-like cation transporter